MSILRNAALLAVIAGLFAGLALAAVQMFTTVPLILQAETFENAAPAEPAAAAPADAHAHAAGTPEHDHAAAPAAEAAGHEHDADAWAPADGFERYAYTFGANALTGIGFALLLIVASELAGGIAGWRQGVLWGMAGFAVFTLAPGLGLPPELPAMPAGDLVARQIWWIGTAIATAAGLALIAFRGTLPLSILGVALIVIPHIIGAPKPDDYATPVPESLHHDFVVAVTVTNLLFWVVLGGLVGALRSRFAAGLGAPQPNLA